MDRASTAAVNSIIVPAIRTVDFLRVQQVTDGLHGAHPAYGLHPLYCDSHTEQDLNALETWLSTQPAVAVGECGLDQFQSPRAELAVQKFYFEAQLGLAKKFNLPVIVHANKAVEQVITSIRASQHDSGVVHSFNGSVEQAKQLLDRGFMLGFGGALTYTRATRLRNLLKAIPKDSWVLETDAPYQIGDGHTTDRNEPAFLHEILLNFADLLGRSPAELASTTCDNARRLFGIATD